MTHPLDSFFDNAAAPVLLIAADDPVVGALPTGFDGSMLALSQVSPGAVHKGGWKTVLLVASDRGALRQAASLVPRLGQCRVVGVWLSQGLSPLPLLPRAEWPPLSSVHGRRLGSPEEDEGVLTVARFEAPVGAHQVLKEMARQAVPGVETTQQGVVLAYAGRPPAPGLDVRALRLVDVVEAGDAERDVPPDVVLVPEPPVADETPAAHHVIDRAPAVVCSPLDPVDEQVYNPIDWRKTWDLPLVELRSLAPGPSCITESVIARARAHQGVQLDLGSEDPQHVLRLAMAGVPLVASGRQPRLDGELERAILERPDLDDPLAREEHSLRLRRLTFDRHSTLAWRQSLAPSGSGAPRHPGLPPVSLLLPTKRPEQLEFALGQVARQRGADIELVLGAHGFAVDRARVAELLGDVPFTLLEFEAEAFFGDVLTALTHAASATLVMKVDDDDWYSPDAVHDVLMARRFSGADVVGMPSEFVYLAEPDLTVRRNHPSERFSRFVAGGTTLLDRTLLSALGDFRRVRRFVDTQLLTAVEAAGGRIYRTHGLGYVLHRTSGGHTWERDAQEFRRPDIIDTEWSGFRPSRAMELDSELDSVLDRELGAERSVGRV
ncbi:hypothetical protein [Nocardioides sp. 616]|uniref:hypothetical protein n=1 Tax=Nocardioides sp. 616 TaxID=2268090 RepID=UPI000CE4A712|nr:hypothetical protein [Nocardioides sp. 616]